MVRKERYVGLGIDRDTAPNERKTDTYWDAENICIMNNGRSLSIKPIKGETVTNQIFPDKLIGPTVSYQRYIVGHITFMENIYVFTTTDPSTTTPRALIPTTAFTDIDNIYKIDSTGTITQLAEARFDFCVGNRIDAVANYETEDIIKLYWVDGYNMLRYFDVVGTSLVRSSQIGVVDIVTLTPIELTVEPGGNLIAGNIQYVYSLYYQHGSQSNLSPASEMVSITGYFDGSGSQENTNLRVKIEITGIDSAYDAIKIYSIHYQELNQSPKVTLIYDAALQGATSLTIYDDGNLQIAELGLSDLLAINYSPVIPNTLAIKRDRLFIANYESQNFNPDVDMRAYSYPISSTTTTLTDGGSSASYSKASLDDLVATHDAINSNYDTQAYQYNSTTLGGTGVNISFTYHYTTVFSGLIAPKSLKQREIYRIGVVLFNKYGQRSPVKWVADIKIPKQSNLNISIGLNVNLVTTTSLTNAGVVGYQMCIVERKPEDRTILAQGFIVPSVRYLDNGGNAIVPYYYPNYIAKDIIPNAISSITPTTNDQKHNAGGDISKDYTLNIDFDTFNNVAPYNRPQINNDVVFFYSSDTIFENTMMVPDKIRVLGTASSTLASSGQIVPAIYDGTTLQGRQPVSPYSTEWITSLGGYWFGGPNYTLSSSIKEVAWPGVPIFEVVMSKRYATTNIKATNLEVALSTAEFIKAGESKVITSGVTVSNTIYVDNIVDTPNAVYVDTNYNAEFCGAMVLKFSSATWHNSGATYPYSDFDVSNMYGGTTGRAIPLVELLRTVPNQYGGNTYESKQRNEYVFTSKNINAVTTGSHLAYLGDITIATLSINRSDGRDNKTLGVQNIYEYVNLPYIENNHNVIGRADNMYQWSIDLPQKTSYNFYRVEDNHSLFGAYNQKPNLFKGYSTPFNFTDIAKSPLSVLGSDAKNINEVLDSWLVFNPNNTKLLEGQYGTITKLHNLSGELIAIQSTGIASLAIEPRIQTQGSDGFQINLGIGTLFYDHRYLTTTTGSNTKFSIADDGKTLYYYDTLQNTINTLHEGKLSTLKTIKGLLDLYTTGPHTTTFFNKLDQVYFQYNEFTLVYDILLQKFVSRHLLLNSNKWLIPNAGILYQIDETLANTTLCTQFTGTPKSTKLIYLMCPDSVYEKMFHNLEYRLIGSNFTNVKVTNDRSDSSTISSDIKTKFDIHRLHLPRVQNSRERFRGIYVFVELNNTSGIDYSLDDMVLMYNIKG